MVSEFKKLLTHLNSNKESVEFVSSWCQEFLITFPTHIQLIVNLWIKTVEKSHQKLALFYLAHDIIKNSNDEELKAAFQKVIPKAISFSVSELDTLKEVKRLLKCWEYKQEFPQNAIAQWEQMCNRALLNGSNNKTHLLLATSLAKKLEELECIEKNRNNGSRTACLNEKIARGEVIKEIVYIIKRIYHDNLNTTLQLQRIHKKLNGSIIFEKW
ncbi:unnamed protein product [Blepharisma stoltei]|uniref:CID domain-containing protein n=1 Tax=Blepharisma stoltei TaxID=1481888 RepID=A0AAU9KF46_9CILI|nr:unnamed protein product [Blepharisma stoltei]